MLAGEVDNIIISYKGILALPTFPVQSKMLILSCVIQNSKFLLKIYFTLSVNKQFNEEYICAKISSLHYAHEYNFRFCDLEKLSSYKNISPNIDKDPYQQLYGR